MSAKERKRESAKERKRESAKGRKRAPPRKNCKQPGLKQSEVSKRGWRGDFLAPTPSVRQPLLRLFETSETTRFGNSQKTLRELRGWPFHSEGCFFSEIGVVPNLLKLGMASKEKVSNQHCAWQGAL